MDKTKILKDGAYQYNVNDLLGEGSFAKVYKGIITKNNRVVAVRLLPLDLIKQYGNKIKQIIKGEVGVLKDLSQSNSVDALFTTRIYDCFLTNHNVVMIIQFCPQGNLEDLVKLGSLTQEKAVPIMYQLARGLQFIAKQKVVHRDIKPDNVFVKNQGKYKVYKLGDFGFAVKKQLNDQIVGTPIFMSPQLFRQQKYGSQVDVWAFGLMVHYILFKEYYFIAATQKQIKNKVLNHQYTLKQHHLKKISSQMADFLTLCLQRDKNKRLPAHKISQHPVFNPAREKVQAMISEVKEISGLQQSKLNKNTVKGQLSNYIMRYQFLSDLASLFSQIDRYNIASLYILKFNLAQLVYLKKQLQMRNNIINHPKWKIFAEGADYMGFLKMVDQMVQTNQSKFQGQFNTILPMVNQRYGNQVAGGIQQNLGKGPYDKMNPAIIIHQLKTNWIPKLSQNKTPQNYCISLECFLAITIFEGKNTDFDYVALQFSKKTLSIQERAGKFQAALKRLQ